MTDPRSRRSLTVVLPDEIDEFYPERILVEFQFGTVYEGTLKEGGRIAVMRLHREWPLLHTEEQLSYLTEHRHENIVKIFHICKTQQKKLVPQSGRHFLVDTWQYYLLMEYASKGTLEKYIKDDAIHWDTRFKIIKGICQGLHFLHTRRDGPVIIHAHLDPNVIWLDDNWVPKILDIGSSRVVGNEQTRINTIHIKGRIEYIALECQYRGEISTKSDIYSLGMLIIFITTGKTFTTRNGIDRLRQHIDTVHRFWMEEDKIASRYPFLSPDGVQQVKTCIGIGLKCVELEQDKRPSIVDIVKKLDGEFVSIFDHEQDEGAGEGRHRPTKVTGALLQISASMKRGRPEKKPMSTTMQ